MKNEKIKPGNVDDYISDFPEDIQSILEKIRTTIRKAAPGALEMISYGIPAFKFQGKPLAYFAAFKNHIGFYPTPTGIDEFEKELSVYKQGKGSVQFPIDKPMPLKLIDKIAKYRMNKILEMSLAKKKK
jgi:uncharacterized protein YdhG (YjbR/CyaY superfamily)